MTNDMEEAEELLDDHDYNLLNILGIARELLRKDGGSCTPRLEDLAAGTWQQNN